MLKHKKVWHILKPVSTFVPRQSVPGHQRASAPVRILYCGVPTANYKQVRDKTHFRTTPHLPLQISITFAHIHELPAI